MLKNIFKKKEIVNHEELLTEWEKNGRPSPPPHIVKQRTIEEFRSKFQVKILVETGTYLGDMVESQRDNFEKIYSIELSKNLWRRAKKRFQSYPHITILEGDSGIALHQLTKEINQPAIFWLDGHYSGGMTAKADKECPVPDELEAILSSPLPHLILIDDARLFNGTHDYPTIEEIKSILHKHGRSYALEIKDDIIRILFNNQ